MNENELSNTLKSLREKIDKNLRRQPKLKNLSALERLKKHIVVDERGRGCWIWQKKINPKGYGYIKFKGRSMQTHRLALEAKLNRKIKDGLYALHDCDNPSCCNPEHLYEGTQFNNMQDAKNRERLKPCRGSTNGQSKLTEKEVVEIRGKAGQKTFSELSRNYGVSVNTISGIVKRKSWRSLL